MFVEIWLILQNKDGKLVPGTLAILVDELRAAVIHVVGWPMDVSTDVSINYLSVEILKDCNLFYLV